MIAFDHPEPMDFLAECDALQALLSDRPEADLLLTTQFKHWTIEDVITHLHAGNLAAKWSLSDPDRLRATLARMPEQRAAGHSLREIQRLQTGGLGGRKLLERWHEESARIADLFAATDPKRRVEWVGPTMSARSSISARLMETWAHGQAIYDRLGKERIERDRVRGIAQLGINTFEWTFRNRDLPVPGSRPYVRLAAPSSEIWTWGEPAKERIEGDAVEFCRVVTQTRCAADTELRIEGATARAWMSIAQCFAGPPEDPPAPGTRHPVHTGSTHPERQETP